MKYIIIGLGNFGGALAAELSAFGHEIIGVDNDAERLELLKDKIALPLGIDATQESELSTISFDDCDATIICIGEDFKSSILITALVKKLCKNKPIISRAFSALQESVIDALNVDQIIMPETEEAKRFANTLSIAGLVDSHPLDGDYMLAEIKCPKYYIDKYKSLLADDFPTVKLLAIKEQVAQKSILRNNTTGYAVNIKLDEIEAINEKDVLVVMGLRKDILKLSKKLYS